MKRAASTSSASATPAKRTVSMPSSATPAKKSTTPSSSTGFSLKDLPKHYYALGEGNYVVVSDFQDKLNVHIRKFRADDNQNIFPTKNGVSFSPFVWETLSNSMESLLLPSDGDDSFTIRRTLFLTTTWIEEVPYISIEKYILRNNNSHQFLPNVCLLSEKEWDRLQCIRKEITQSCKCLMFEDILKNKIMAAVAARSPRNNLEMEKSDVEMILTTSLTELLAKHFEEKINIVSSCDGCKDNQPNQLAHECMTMNHDRRNERYGTLALLSIDIELLVKDFLDQNASMLNYVNMDFLNTLNMKTLVKNAIEFYIASDMMPDRIF